MAEANSTCMEKLDLTENAIEVLEKRYLQRDKEGKCVETPADLLQICLCE